MENKETKKCKKREFLFNYGLMIIFFSALIFSAVIYFTIYKLDDKENGVLYKNSSYVIEDLYFYNNEHKITDLKEIKKEYDKITLYYNIPNDVKDSYALCLDNSFQLTKASIDDKVIYEYGENEYQYRFGDQVYNCWDFIELSEEDAGKILIIEMDNLTRKTGQINKVYYGEKAIIIKNILLSNLFNIVFFIFVVLASIVCLLFMIIAYIVYRQKNSVVVINLLIFSFISAIWVFSNSGLLQLFNNNIALNYYCSCSSFMLAMIPLLWIINSVSKKKNLFITIMSYFLCLEFIIVVILHITNVIDMGKLLFITHLCLVVLVIYLIYWFVKEYKNRNEFQDSKGVIIGIMIFALTSSFDLISYYTGMIQDYSFFFKIGLIILYTTIIIVTLRRIMLTNINIKEKEVYKKLAYIDMMTNLGNRTAFEAKVEIINNNILDYSSVCFIICDLNHLKEINDNYGHPIGDMLIKGVADCLLSSFDNQEEIYRMGGDEFTVILTNVTQRYVTNKIDLLKENINVFNKSSEYKINLAMGYELSNSLFLADNSLDINYVYKLADDNMYEDKKRYKEHEKV